MVERANKETMRHLRNIVFHSKIRDKWSRNLPLVQRIMNANTIESIGASPAQIIFGNSIALDRWIFAPHLFKEADKTKLSSLIADMLQSQKDIIQIAQKTQTIRDNNHYARVTNYRTVPNSQSIASWLLILKQMIILLLTNSLHSFEDPIEL